MKKIIAIGSLDTFPCLLASCSGTLSKYARNGDETFLLITRDAQHDKTRQEKSTMESVRRAANCIDISKVFFIERFNHNTVSQNNVNLLRSFIESISPTLVLIPYRKSINSRQSVLGSSAFLACRWITNILLYEIDRNPNFVPTILSSLSDDEYAAKLKSINEFGSNGGNRFPDKSKKTKSLHNMKAGNIRYHEIFESHRLVLLSANDVV